MFAYTTPLSLSHTKTTHRKTPHTHTHTHTHAHAHKETLPYQIPQWRKPAVQSRANTTHHTRQDSLSLSLMHTHRQSGTTIPDSRVEKTHCLRATQTPHTTPHKTHTHTHTHTHTRTHKKRHYHTRFSRRSHPRRRQTAPTAMRMHVTSRSVALTWSQRTRIDVQLTVPLRCIARFRKTVTVCVHGCILGFVPTWFSD
jgi:hypothetical protein